MAGIGVAHASKAKIDFHDTISYQAGDWRIQSSTHALNSNHIISTFLSGVSESKAITARKGNK